MSEYTIQLQSKELFVPVSVTVLTPDPSAADTSAREFYQSGKKYKVLWLLHGAAGDHRQWLDYTKIRTHVRNREVIVVMPAAQNSDYGNNPQFGSGFQYMDFFFEELMPFIHNWFPASAAPEDNFISGLSMGAYGAALYGLVHPERFGGVAPLSASFREPSFLEPFREYSGSEFRKILLSDRTAFPTEYGPEEERIKLKEINLITKYETVGDYLDSAECMWNRFPEVASAGKLPRLFIGCGMDDWYYPMLLRLQAYAEQLNVTDITFDFVPGYGHDYDFWDMEIVKVMEHFGI